MPVDRTKVMIGLLLLVVSVCLFSLRNELKEQRAEASRAQFSP